MTKQVRCWLTTLAVAAAVTGTSLRMSAVETGPEKAVTPQTDPAGPARSGNVAPGTKRETYPFRGKVASFDAAAQALKLAGRTTQRVVHLTAQTRLTKLGQPAVPEDLKAGEVVGGTLRKNAEGREEAVLIRIGPKPDANNPEGAAAKPIGTKEEVTN